MPTINTKLSAIFVILGAFVVLSYFTHVAWWALTGLMLFLAVTAAGWDEQNHRLQILGNILGLVGLVFFFVAIFRTGWVF
jgi:hypothetical protein